MPARHQTGDVNRLAALALGLTSAGRHPDVILDLLIEESNGSPRLLTLARTRVDGSFILDRHSHRRASELLEAAIDRVDVRGRGARALRSTG